MVPISSKRRQRTNNNESQAIISTKSTKMIEVVTSTSNTQDVNRSTISTTHTNQSSTTVQYCSICSKNNAKYKCPRCNIPYCSVSCYQIHDGTSFTAAADHSSTNNSNNKICTRHVLTNPNNNNTATTTNNRVQSVLSNIHNEIHINLDKLDYRDGCISNLINKNEGDGGEIVNGMIEEIKDNVCKSERSLDVFKIEQLNNSKVEEVVHEISSRFKQEDRVQQQQRQQDVRVKKDKLSIGKLISGMNTMDSDNIAGDSDVISSGILNLGLGSSSTQRPLVVEDEMVSTTIRKK